MVLRTTRSRPPAGTGDDRGGPRPRTADESRGRAEGGVRAPRSDGAGDRGRGAPTDGRAEASSKRPRRGLSPRRRVLLVRLVVWAFGLTPLALLARRAVDRGLGANPIEALILHFGIWGLTLLVATLAVTPLRRLTGVNVLIRARRPLGLFAFCYITLHFLSYLVLDQFFAWAYIVEDIVERPFITVGFAAFVMLIPLAVTSTKGWIRRLGKNWRRLHRLVYPAAALGLIHYYWNVRADELDPLVYGAVLGILLLSRVPFRRGRRRRPESARDGTGRAAGKV